jgi:Oxysterol-binding protein
LAGCTCQEQILGQVSRVYADRKFVFENPWTRRSFYLVNTKCLFHLKLIFCRKKVISCVHNVIGGSPWLENYGEMKIVNHTTGDVCQVLFKKEKGIFSSSSNNDVVAIIKDHHGEARYQIQGCWNSHLRVSHVRPTLSKLPSTCLQQTIWSTDPALCPNLSQYGFNRFSCVLNELTEDIRSFLPQTDTRLRPDQRLYEHGQLLLAEAEKSRLEELQRSRRKEMDLSNCPWTPNWFRKTINPLTNEDSWELQGDYWVCKEIGKFPSTLPGLW